MIEALIYILIGALAGIFIGQWITQARLRYWQREYSKLCDEYKTEAEWFFRWIARGKGGHTPMDRAIDMIWHRPDNPYSENNPWQSSPDASDPSASSQYDLHAAPVDAQDGGASTPEQSVQCEEPAQDDIDEAKSLNVKEGWITVPEEKP